MNILFEYILLILFIILKKQELHNLSRKFLNNKNLHFSYKHVIKKIDTYIYIYIINQIEIIFNNIQYLFKIPYCFHDPFFIKILMISYET